MIEADWHASFATGVPDIRDIAVGLSRECRFAGSGIHFWPVALHSCVVANLLPTRLRLHGLLHDAAECVTGDIPRTVKTAENRALEVEILRAIYAKLELPLPTLEQKAAVKAADYAALCGEIYTVGTFALRRIYPRHLRAEELVDLYRFSYGPADCIDSNGKCVQSFLYKYKRYRELGGFNATSEVQ